jgi:hypothetical protein
MEADQSHQNERRDQEEEKNHNSQREGQSSGVGMKQNTMSSEYLQGV